MPVVAVGAVGVPVSDGEASRAKDAAAVPPRLAALMLELHANPLPLAHCSAFAELLQLGIVNAVKLPVELVAFASTEFAACCAIWPSATPFVATDTVTLPVAPLTATPEPATTESTIEDQAGDDDAPVDTIA
ncbi:TPA: hypothetical protein QDB44_004009 [Burkholderia vietnamiensis]|nr:hypothetical protein [Burkholderia vietnamiensis]